MCFINNKKKKKIHAPTTPLHVLHFWFPQDQLLLWLEMFNSRLSKSEHTLIARENNFNAKIMFCKANGRIFLIIIIMPRFLCQFVSLTFKEAGPGHKIIPESLWEALSFFRRYKNHPFGFFTAHSESREFSTDRQP